MDIVSGWARRGVRRAQRDAANPLRLALVCFACRWALQHAVCGAMGSTPGKQAWGMHKDELAHGTRKAVGV
jgi:hypothetical protein